jgi:hypothetical protein
MAGMIGLFGEGLLIKDGDKAIGDVLEKQTVSCTGRCKKCSGRMNAINLLKKIKKKFTNGVSMGTPTSKINRYHTHSCYTMKLLDDLKDAEFGVLIMSYLGRGSNRVAYKQTCIGRQAPKNGRHHNTCCQTMTMLDDLRDNEFSVLMRSYNWHGSSMMEQGETSL